MTSPDTSAARCPVVTSRVPHWVVLACALLAGVVGATTANAAVETSPETSPPIIAAPPGTATTPAPATKAIPSPGGAEVPPLPVPTATAATDERRYHVVALTLSGLNRTDPSWLTQYVDTTFPTDLRQTDLAELQRKLLTTAIFTRVAVTLDPAADAPGSYRLHVDVAERWTTIPFVRAAYGGGTPLRVLGFYDINILGRLLTLGGEVRQYGSAPPGFVLYGRDPRGDSNRYYLGEELWREFRRRQIFDAKGTYVGNLSSTMAMNRLRLLVPLNGDSDQQRPWKYGGDIEYAAESPSSFTPTADSKAPGGLGQQPDSLYVTPNIRNALKLLPTLLYDDIEVDHIEYEGLRAKLKAGPIFALGNIYSAVESENYYYRMLGHDWNFGMRLLAGQTSYATLQNEYFLGGLDTIRGLPDGAIYGADAAYTNIELRYLAKRTKYLWIQSAAFVDAGMAGASWREAGTDPRASAGFGVRLAVPQVYRFVLRIDYAWSLIGPHTQGITAGLNQFFDPFIPL